jgi:hypothetical protein
MGPERCVSSFSALPWGRTVRRESDEEESPHGSDRDGDSSEDQDEENGIYELCGLNCDSHAPDEEEEDARERLPESSDEQEDSKSLQESESDINPSEDVSGEEEDNDEPHRDEDNPTDARSTISSSEAHPGGEVVPHRSARLKLLKVKTA